MYKAIGNVTDYNINIENFEGPLELLCNLIDKNKMSIFDINLSALADQYMEYIEKMEKMNVEVASEFLVMAANLLYIKSKKLLPEENESNEEEEDTEELLIKRILEYKRYKEVTCSFKEMYDENKGIFVKQPEKIKLPRKQIEQEYEKILLYKAYTDIINRKKEVINIQSQNLEKLAVYERVTVKSKVKQILSELMKKTKFVFSKLFEPQKQDKLEVVTAFMGMLELAKSKKVKVSQDQLFGDIVVEKVKVNRQ